MNRRSLIALGLATALARFFPGGIESKPLRWSLPWEERDAPIDPWAFEGSQCRYDEFARGGFVVGFGFAGFCPIVGEAGPEVIPPFGPP